MVKAVIKFIRNIFCNSSEQEIFTLTNITGSPEHKNVFIHYRVKGKSVTLKEKPGKLVDEMLLLKGFSKMEAEIIHAQAVLENIAPIYQIINVSFHELSSTFYIKDLRNGFIFSLKSEEILSENSIAEGLSVEDLQKITFQYFYVYFQNLSKEKQQIKKVIPLENYRK